MADNTPGIPVVEKTTVPASAIFSADELTPPAPPVTSGEGDLKLPPAAPAKPADTTPAPKPGEPTAPAAPAAPAPEPKPGEPAAPAKPGEPASPTAPAAPAPAPAAKPKIKIGDKEYTEKELEDALAAKSAPAPAPAAPAAPAPVPPKPPTAEEIATAEGSWMDKFIKEEKLALTWTEQEMETILAGGKEGVAAMAGKIHQTVAKAVLLARKTIFQDLNPVIEKINSQLSPVLQNTAQVERAAAEHVFFTSYPDFKAHAQTVRQVGEALLTRYPEECAKFTPQQLMAEVAAQADRIIQAQCSQFAPGKNWRELGAAAPAPAPAAPAAPAPAAPAPAAPAAPAKVAAPAGNSPAGTAAPGATKDWHKGTADSLKS